MGLLVFYVAKQLNTPSTPIVQVRTAGPNQNFSGETLSGNSLSGAEGMFRNLKAGDGVYIFDIKATANGLGNYVVPNISPVLINIQ